MKDDFVYPDFYIAGAMKCGTTAMHHSLGSHPDIFIPKGELKFFAIDDPLHLASLNFNVGGPWGNSLDFDRDAVDLQRWYFQNFRERSSELLVGEDSPVYMLAPLAPARIKEANEESRFIFMLRDPVERTYSQYWHMVKNGTAVYSFEEQIRAAPAVLLEKSYYLEQLSRYL